jgi:glyceraldehyde 3-phosphate dehydrogenase
VPLFHKARPEEIPWEETGATIVVEATGRFRKRKLAAGHLARTSVRAVVVSATVPDADATLCYGHNEKGFDPSKDRVLSAASCTTHCLAAVLAVLETHYGVARAFMNTVHCVTNSQNLVDMAHPDLRRARSALGNLIPTTSDAVPSIGWVFPRLRDRVVGYAVRVPVVAGSLLDVVVELERDGTLPEVQAAYREASRGSLAGILAVSEEPLVSSDFIDSPFSATVDLPLLQALGSRSLRVVAWYDNEWGYSNRLAELLAYLGSRLEQN